MGEIGFHGTCLRGARGCREIGFHGVCPRGARGYREIGFHGTCPRGARGCPAVRSLSSPPLSSVLLLLFSFRPTLSSKTPSPAPLSRIAPPPGLSVEWWCCADRSGCTL